MNNACVSAKFWDDLELMPGGLDFEVGHRGKYLSGGQKQRLCLARCILRGCPIIILDEPVSAQDPQTADDVSEMLQYLTFQSQWGPRPVTVFAVSHNLEFFSTFTHIIFVANGTVVECGTKDQLVAKKGHYYRRMVQQSGISVDQRGRATITPERLRTIWLFSTAPSLGLQDLAKTFSSEKYSRGEEVTKKGADADAMYVLVAGSLKADEYTEGDDTMVWSPGQDLGADALVDDTSRWQMTVRVNSDSAVLLELRQTDFEALLEKDEGLRESVGQTVRHTHTSL